MVKPDSGSIHMDGELLNGNCSYRNDIGYMPQTANYPENMTIRELAAFITEIRGQKAVYRNELISLFGLENEMDKALRVLSGGTRQKAGALIALMFDAPVLILDEPTAGLDPVSSYRFKQWISEEKERGKTILLSTHISSEIEALAEHLLVLDEGAPVYYGPKDNYIRSTGEDHLEGAIAKRAAAQNNQRTSEEVPA